VPGDLDVGVARDGHHRGRGARSEAGHVDHQQCVGPSGAEVAAGREIGLLLRGQSLAAVRADQQPGRTATRRGSLWVVGQCRDAVQVPIEPEPRADKGGRGDQQDDERVEEQNPPPAAFAAWLGCRGRARWGRPVGRRLAQRGRRWPVWGRRRWWPALGRWRRLPRGRRGRRGRRLLVSGIAADRLRGFARRDWPSWDRALRVRPRSGQPVLVHSQESTG
jgi:hypothetical protein